MSDLAISAFPTPWSALRANLRRNTRRMIPVFLGMSALGIGAAQYMAPSYKSNSVLMVRLGAEYLVNADPATTSVFMERKEMVASETAMLTAPELAAQVIDELGLAKIYPDIAAKIDPDDPISAANARERAILAFGKNLSVLPVKDSTLLSVSFTNHDPELAAAVLDRVLADYIERRRAHFEYSVGNAVSNGLSATRIALDQTATRLQQFKKNHQITNFDIQMAHYADERLELAKARDKAQSDVAALTAEAASLTDALKAIGRSVPLRAESSESDAARDVREALAKLELHEGEMTLAFRDGAPQLDDLHRQIDTTKSLVGRYGRQQTVRLSTGRPASYDSTEGSLKQAQASLAASTVRAATLDDQINALDTQVAQLEAGREQLEQLQREDKLAEDAFFQAGKRVNETRAHDLMMETNKPNVEVVQAPRVPFKETLTRLIVGASGVLLGGIFASLLAWLDSLGRRPRGLA